MPKNAQTTIQLAFISHVRKVMLKILRAWLQQYMNHELLDVQAGFTKAKESEIKLWTTAGSLKKQKIPEKHLFLLYWLCQSFMTVWIATKCGKFWKRWEYQTTWLASWETCKQVRKQQLELVMEQTGSKLGKEYVKAVYCHPAYLTYMQSTSWKR